MITLNVLLSFVAIMTETGGVAKRSVKKGKREVERSIWHREQNLVARSRREDDRKLNRNLSVYFGS